MRATCKMAARLSLLILEGRDATTGHVPQLPQTLSTVTAVPHQYQDQTRSDFFTVNGVFLLICCLPFFYLMVMLCVLDVGISI